MHIQLYISLFQHPDPPKTYQFSLKRNPISHTVQIHTLHILRMHTGSICPTWHAENWDSEELQHFSHNTQGISGKGGKRIQVS